MKNSKFDKLFSMIM